MAASPFFRRNSSMTRHVVGLHPGAAAKQMIYRLLRGAALHHATVNL